MLLFSSFAQDPILWDFWWVLKLVLFLLSLLHVGYESIKLRDHPTTHLILNFIFWPFAYVLWLFLWPGLLLEFLRTGKYDPRPWEERLRQSLRDAGKK